MTIAMLCHDVVIVVCRCRLSIPSCGAAHRGVHPVCRPRCNAVLLFFLLRLLATFFWPADRKLILTNKTNENDNENDTGGQHVESVW